jgi:hypothetical protein
MADEVREIGEHLGRINELLQGPYKLAYLRLTDLKPAARNARHMTSIMFGRLKENIAKDKALGSLPLCWRNLDGTFEIMSGHHRISAAIQAGVEYSLVLYTDAVLSSDERVAIQLSHNALSGHDDVQALLELSHSIGDPKLLRYASIDLLDLPKLNPTGLLSLTEAKMTLRPVLFYLTDYEAQTLQDFVEEYNSRPLSSGALGFIVHIKEFEAFMQKLQELAEKHHLVNANGALSEMVEIMAAHLAESGQPEVTAHKKSVKANA